MIGIYRIVNDINQHCYIGQSVQIEKRWQNHKVAAFNINDKGYEYPLYRAFRKYGIENFTFEIIEECSQEELNEKEHYWISYYQPEYNQTEGGDYQIIPQKLTLEEVKEIQEILLNDIEGKISHVELAEKYNVKAYTIQDINSGRTWHNSNYNYPLHLSKYDSRRNHKHYCIDCGIEIFKTSTRCLSCSAKAQAVPLDQMPVTREELKNLIRTTPFTTIGKQFGISDNAIRKWCIKFNLPTKSREIKKYTEDEWEQI